MQTRSRFEQKSQEQKQAIAQQMVEAMLADPSIEDCVVLNRAKETSAPEFVAYVVSAGKFSPEKIHSHLQATLPSYLLPIAYVPLSKLPLTSTGQVDEQALAAIEVIDSDLVQRWETQLQSLPEIEQAAVVVQEFVESSSSLHLSDLLPDLKSTPSTSAATATVNQDSLSHEESASKQSAIAFGGILLEELDAPTTLPEVLQRAARQTTGDSIIYLQPDGFEIAQSYENLLEEAERILAGLRNLGLKPQDKVIFQLELNQDIIPAFWGCILGGFIPVIMGVAPTYTTSNNAVDKLCNVWQLLDSPLILTTESLQKSVQSLTQWLPTENFKVSAIEGLRKNERDRSYHPSKPHDPAFFNLTSGSTGMPKCISLTHWNLISRARGTNILSQHNQKDVILNWLPFDHIGSISDWHIRCVDLGCKLIYATKEYILGRPLNWLDLIDKYRITHSWAPNFAYALIYDALKQEAKHKWDLSCVKSLLTAGEAVSSSAVKDFIESLAIYGFKKTAIRPAFGMAEMGSGITYYQPTEENPLLFHTVDKYSLNGFIKRVNPEHPNCSTFTDLGAVIPGVTIRIVDRENSVLSEDTIGYLQVKGDAVFSGYYKNPEVNKEVFVEDGWFNTGDLGFISNGHLVVTGRAKETIIINGANYYNHEIEAVVEELEEVDVSYTAACAVRDAKGNTDKLAIFFSASDVDEKHLIELIKQIRQIVVAKVGANPDYLIPVEKEVIPKTAIGKIQRSQLSKLFENGEFNSTIKKLDILLRNANTLPDWFYRQTWQPKEAVTLTTQPLTTSTLVFLDRLGLGESICAELSRQQQPYISVELGSNFAKLGRDRYQIDPQNPNCYRQLFQSFSKENLQIGQILHLWNYDNYSGEISSPEALEQLLELGIYSLLFLVQALAKEHSSKQPVRLLVAASHTQSTSPSDKVAPEKAPILGVVKVVSQELPWLDCRHVDLSLDSVEINAERILRELQVLQRSPQIAYRQNLRLVPCLEKVDWSQLPKQELPFKQRGMYLLSGGLGGIGVEIAKYLLQNYNARLLLVGRTPLPNRSQWDVILQQGNVVAERIEAYLSIEQLGGEISYQAVDICDRTRLQQVVDRAKSVWQCELDGVIHLAGTASQRLLVEETRESLAATLSSKVLGTWVLHQLLKDRPNSVFISSSSVNSFFGGTAASAYAAANSFQDSFSHYQRHQCSLQSYCFAWSMWDEVGMSRGYQMKEFSRAQGYYPIARSRGMHSLLIGLHHNQGQLLVGLDGSNRNIRQYIEPQLDRRVQTLSAYFTAKTGSVSSEQLEALLVRDRFGTTVTCTFHQLGEMPLTATGEIDRAQLVSIGRLGTTEQVKPRTELESQLANIWQQVLGVSQVGIHDNFFELGGSSLQAARLFAEIEKTFSKNLPLATLLEAPTIEQLATLLSESQLSTSWSSLVPIQPNGSKPPLFCIHGAGGNVLNYHKLSHHLGSNQPLYGLQARGLDGQQDFLTSVEDMAACYMKEILELQPEGPYFLGGFSIGGLIAFEVAQRLQAQGQKVALLALFDTYTPKLLPNPNQSLRDKFSRHSSSLLELKPQAVMDYVVNKAKGKLKSLKQKSQKITYQFYQSIGRPLPQTQRNVLVWDVNARASRAYELQVYTGRITLFRASDLADDLGWGKLAGSGLEIHNVPGKHSDVESEGMLTEPHVRVLAEKLRVCLEKAQTNS